MEAYNKGMFLKYESWKEFELNSGFFVGKIPRIFAVIHDDVILTAKDIAELLEVNEETVRRWIRSNKLRVHSPVGRYKVWGEDLKEFIYRWWRSEFLKVEE